MTVFDIDESQGAWFEMEGGGRVQIRTMSAAVLKAIRQKTVKKKIDYKKVDGTPGRFEYEEVNDDLQNELFWDHCIVSWENFYDAKGNSIEVNKPNKVMLISRSPKFARFVADCLKTLTDEEAATAETLEKN